MKLCPRCSTTERTKQGKCRRCHNDGNNRRRLALEPQATMLRMARKRARKQGLPCSIRLSDIVVPEFCPVLGIPLFVQGQHVGPHSPTLDKLIPELGYVSGNICVISNKANLIKSNASIADLQAVLVYMKLTRLKETNA
jgi:hypothetical protein